MFDSSATTLVQTLATALAVCSPSPPPTRVAGLDVSDHQAKTQWQTIRQSGRQFAFVKATEGVTFRSRNFTADWEQIPTAGMSRGAYHYFRADDDPIQQADFFLSVIGDLAPGDLPAVLDLEELRGIDVQTVIQRAQLWLDRVEGATGKTPILYTYPNFWASLGKPAGFERYPLFIASYGVQCPTVPAPWTNWTFWQLKVGNVPGVVGASADIDVFNGDLDALSALASSPAQP